MRWSPATIAHYATGAGFVRPDVYTATAIALAASGGIDHYDHSPGVPGAGRYVGLWGVDTDEWPDLAHDVLTPHGAAVAAYELTRRCGGFDWSSCARAGAHLRHLDTAVQAMAGRPFTETVPAPITVLVGRHHLDDIRRELADRMRGLQTWPIPSR